jgi:hypothetical protein
MKQYDRNAVYKITYTFQWGRNFETRTAWATTSGNMVDLAIHSIIENECGDILDITKIHDDYFEYIKLVALGQI